MADTPDEFAAAVVALLRDPGAQGAAGPGRPRFAGARYDWRIIVPRLERVYETELNTATTQHALRTGV